MSWRWTIPILGALWSVGCGPPGPRVSQLEVGRTSWDTVYVSVHFEGRGGLGRPVAPLDRRLVLFDAAYDTLYAGADTAIVIPDRDLGNAEPLLIEACGRFTTDLVCEQRTVNASPKRVQSEITFGFPEDTGFARGSYQITPTVERRVFGSEDTWEAIDRDSPLPMHAVVRVADAAPSGVQIPLGGLRGRFDLGRLRGYRDFRYHLRSQMYDEGQARVAFDLYADLGTGAQPAGSREQPVRLKTQEQRVQELGVLVDRAGRILVDRLKGFLGVRRTLVFVNKWSYRPADGQYDAEMELHWRNAASGIWHEITGRLVASEDGSSARFRFLRGNRAAIERWEREMDRLDVNLGSIAADPASRSW